MHEEPLSGADFLCGRSKIGFRENLAGQNGGLGDVAPTKKDWTKTGVSEQPVSQPKNRGKNVEHSKPKPDPRSSLDLDRSR